jgi:wyosine [tRNA(Phe)-imidazoG37] synthetase (radical SAM superfamily)
MTGDVNPAILFSNRLLDLTLLPIEQCNFRCTYCYETFADGKMKPDRPPCARPRLPAPRLVRRRTASRA